MRQTRRRISNAGHKRDWRLSIQRQQRLGRGLLGRPGRILELDEHGLEPIAAPSSRGSAIDKVVAQGPTNWKSAIRQIGAVESLRYIRESEKATLLLAENAG